MASSFFEVYLWYNWRRYNKRICFNQKIQGDHISSRKKSFGGLEPQGEKPSAEEFDKFDEFIQEFGHSDRNDDWWMERKGGYEVTFEYEGESEDQKK